MARKPRIHVPGGFYHVTLRGNHRQDIFETPADRALMESLVAHASRELRARVHAYCWMTNHIHLLVEVGNAPLGALLQRIAGPYARQMHKRVETTGHLFERRHFARLVDSERYLLQVIRYTHFNPVRAGLAPRPDDYPWTSHHAYLGSVSYPWLTTNYALSMLGSTAEEAGRAYRRYMREAEGTTLPSPFEESVRAGSGKRRLNTRSKDVEADPERPRVAAVASLESLIMGVCAAHGVSVDAIGSPLTSQRLTAARTEIARRALEHGTANLSQVARALGRSTAAIHKALRRT